MFTAVRLLDLLWRQQQEEDAECVELSIISQIPAPDHALEWTEVMNMNLYTLLVNKAKKNFVAWNRDRTVPPNDRRLSAILVPTFADWGCHVGNVTDPYGRILGFLDRSRYIFFQVAPQLNSRGWVDPVPDPLLLR
jgi:hypothetical protein